jgi:hypothetical protein
MPGTEVEGAAAASGADAEPTAVSPSAGDRVDCEPIPAPAAAGSLEAELDTLLKGLDDSALAPFLHLINLC